MSQPSNQVKQLLDYASGELCNFTNTSKGLKKERSQAILDSRTARFNRLYTAQDILQKFNQYDSSLMSAQIIKAYESNLEDITAHNDSFTISERPTGMNDSDYYDLLNRAARKHDQILIELEEKQDELNEINYQNAADNKQIEKMFCLAYNNYVKLVRNKTLTIENKQDLANKAIHYVSHKTCQCARVPYDSTIDIIKSSTGKASTVGLVQCGSVWTCPVCAAKINERKAKELRDGFNSALSQNLTVSLVTFTAPHTASDTIQSLKDKMSSAMSSFWQGGASQRFKAKYGIKGFVRSFEVRYGEKGWHPHFHLVVFSEFDIKIAEQEVLKRWQSACVKSGLSKPNEYGIDIRDGSQAGEYITKYGSDDDIMTTKSGDTITWDMSDEMTKGNTKTGKSLSPFQLLEAYENATTEIEKCKYYGLFLSFARAFKGVSQLKWSRGLRELFELSHEISDEQIILIVDDEAKIRVAEITKAEWKHVVKNKLHSAILSIAEEENSTEILSCFLHSVCDIQIPLLQYIQEFRERLL